MPIRFACPACQKALKAPDGSAGLKMACPRCGQRLAVSQPALDHLEVAAEGNRALARVRCRIILEEYASTKAAKGAKALLDRLNQ